MFLRQIDDIDFKASTSIDQGFFFSRIKWCVPSTRKYDARGCSVVVPRVIVALVVVKNLSHSAPHDVTPVEAILKH